MASFHIPNLCDKISDTWFSEKIAPDGDAEDGCHPDEAGALKAYLLHEISAQEASRAITRPVENSRTPNSELPRLWDLLMSAIMELPSEHTISLVNLLRAVEDLPEPDMSAIEDSEKLTHGRLWSQLPGFGHQYADLYQSGYWRANEIQADPSMRNNVREVYVKRAKIEAHLVAAKVAGITIDWGYETVADALEKSDAVLHTEIDAAVEWFRIAGNKFREGVASEEQSWALNRKRDLWHGGATMTVERWSFWKSRLRGLESRSEVVQNAATAALVAMEGKD